MTSHAKATPAATGSWFAVPEAWQTRHTPDWTCVCKGATDGLTVGAETWEVGGGRPHIFGGVV